MGFLGAHNLVLGSVRPLHVSIKGGASRGASWVSMGTPRDSPGILTGFLEPQMGSVPIGAPGISEQALEAHKCAVGPLSGLLFRDSYMIPRGSCQH